MNDRIESTDLAEAARLADERTELGNCLDLVRTRQELSRLRAEHRRLNQRLRVLVFVAALAGLVIGAVLA